MSMLLRLAAATELALTVVDATYHQQRPPAGIHQLGLAFVSVFIITEFGAGWHVLWKHLKARRRRSYPLQTRWQS